MAVKHIVKLSSSTGKIFEVDEVVALQSQLVRNLIEDVDVDSPISLPNVSSDILEEVLRYCKCYVETQTNADDLLEALEDDLNEWPRAKLVKSDMDNLYDLIMVANYMHIETLLYPIYHTIAMIIVKKTFWEIQHIFNFGNDFARGEESLIGKESQNVAPFIESLPTKLQLKVKIKVGQRFHHGEWSSWKYDVDAQTLFVELASLYDAYDMRHQIAIIHMLIDIGLVNTLVLQTCCIHSVSPHQSGEARIEWAGLMDMDLFKDLVNGIDFLKVENVIFDEEIIH